MMSHRLSKTPLYKVWLRMKGSTESPTHRDFKYYGAKGIKVCEEWRNNFQSFYDWAVSNGYERGLTIDRINPLGDYSPDNCQWLTIQKQQCKRSDSWLITIDGEIKCLSEWCKIYNINRYTVRSRILSGWSEIDALTVAPVRHSTKEHRKRCTIYKKNGCNFIEP